MTGQAPGRRVRLASPAMAIALAGVVLALLAATIPLGVMDHSAVSSGGGSLVLAPVFGVLGFVVAWRKPGNPLGWLLLGAVGFLVLSGAAGSYAVAVYRQHHPGLPLGWVAVLLQPGWAPAIALFGLTVLLFPDGLPARPALALGAVGVPGRRRPVDRGDRRHLRVGHRRAPRPGGLRRESAGHRPSHRMGGMVGNGAGTVLPAAGRLLAGWAAGAELPAFLRGAAGAAEMADRGVSDRRHRWPARCPVLKQPGPGPEHHRVCRPGRGARAAAQHGRGHPEVPPVRHRPDPQPGPSRTRSSAGCWWASTRGWSCWPRRCSGSR